MSTLNYKASLITIVDTAGDTHTYPAFKIKGLSGRGKLTSVIVEPVEGAMPRTIEADEKEQELRARWEAALSAGEG